MEVVDDGWVWDGFGSVDVGVDFGVCVCKVKDGFVCLVVNGYFEVDGRFVVYVVNCWEFFVLKLFWYSFK